MGAKNSYPRHFPASQEFTRRLDEEKSPHIEVSDLLFTQHHKRGFTASFFVRIDCKPWRQEVIIGRALPSLDAIENEIIVALRPNGMFA